MFNAAWLYKNYTYKIEKLKWADSLRSITKIVLNERKNLEMKIYYDSKINKIETSSEKIKEKSKDSRGFLFISLKDKQLFISNIRKLLYRTRMK